MLRFLMYIYIYIEIYRYILTGHSLKASLIFQYMLETLSWSGRRGGGEHLSLNLDMWHPLQNNYVKRVPNNFEIISF